MKITRGSIFLPLTGGVMSGAIDFPDAAGNFITHGTTKKDLWLGAADVLHVGNTGGSVAIDPAAAFVYRSTDTDDSFTSKKSTAPRTLVRKSVDETVNNSITLQADDELLFPVIANEITEFDLNIFVASSAVADWKYNFAVPAGGTIVSLEEIYDPNAGAVAKGAKADENGNSFNMIGTVLYLRIRGVYKGAAAAGNVQLQWAQNTAEVSDTKVLTGSLLSARRVA